MNKKLRKLRDEIGERFFSDNKYIRETVTEEETQIWNNINELEEVSEEIRKLNKELEYYRQEKRRLKKELGL